MSHVECIFVHLKSLRHVRSQHLWSLHTYHLILEFPIETEHLVIEERSMPLFIDLMVLTYAI
jgi:hypothetical protein